jgi:hypothetical protein
VSARHYSEDDLTLYYYGEGRRRDAIEKHLAACAACASLYRDIAGTLQLVVVPEPPERGEQYGLEVWQRIRHKLPERPEPWWAPWFHHDRLTLAAAAAMLVLVAFVAGRVWPRQPAAPAGTTEIAAGGAATAGGGSAAAGDSQQRILLTAVAEHLDRSERVLTDIMNASDAGDISNQQRWADDLLTTSRLYRQDAKDAGEQSVADVLDDLERSLLEIVNSPAKISVADLEQIRRRIDAAALLFKVRVMGEELRQRELTRERSTPRTPTQKVS